RITGITLQGREVLKPILEDELTSLKELGVAELSPRSMGGSDHMSFEGAGVPGLMFRQDPAEYRLTHHSQADTLDKAHEADLTRAGRARQPRPPATATGPPCCRATSPPTPGRRRKTRSRKKPRSRRRPRSRSGDRDR